MLNIISHQGNTIKTTMKRHFISKKIAVLKNDSKKCYQECGEIRTLIHC